MTFNQAILTSSILHLIVLLYIIIIPRINPQEKETYAAIEVAIIGNFKDLPTIAKKDALNAVQESLGKKSGTKKLETPSKTKGKEASASERLKLYKKGKKDSGTRSDIIERLARINRLKQKRLKGILKGSPSGSKGIKGTTVAQASGKGVHNWYIRRAQIKIKENFYIPPKFDGDNPSLMTVVLLKLNPNGTIHHVEISKSSGNQIYDDFSYGAVKSSEPFGEVPDKYKKLFKEVGFGLRFKRSDFE